MPATIYLDYTASTPVDPAVMRAMLPYFETHYGNPSNITHNAGCHALQAVHRARRSVQRFIDAENPCDIVFTSGATESNNWVIQSIAQPGDEIIVSSIEHKSILKSAKELQGITVKLLPVDSRGIVQLTELEALITPKTRLVSVMFVNNEVGSIQPVREIGTLCRQKKVLFHCDAVQAAGKIPFSVQDLPIDLLSLSAHKMYGPKGIGILYIHPTCKETLAPLIKGGSQEFCLRAGTLNVPSIVGMGQAAEILSQNLEVEIEKLKTLKQDFKALLSEIPGLHFTIPEAIASPAIIHFCLEGVSSKALASACPDLAFSGGSACSSNSGKPSYVLDALGIDSQLACGGVRLSIGRMSDQETLKQAASILKERIEQLRDKRISRPFSPSLLGAMA